MDLKLKIFMKNYSIFQMKLIMKAKTKINYPLRGIVIVKRSEVINIKMTDFMVFPLALVSVCVIAEANTVRYL